MAAKGGEQGEAAAAFHPVECGEPGDAKGVSQGNGNRAGRGEDESFIVVIVVFPILPLPVALGEAFVPLVPYTVFI